MLKTTLFACSATLLASLAASAGLSAAPGVPIASGDRIYGNIDAAADRDAFCIEVPEGARVAVTVSAAGKSALLPTLELTRPNGTAVNLGLALQGEGSNTAVIPGLRFDETGTYAVSIRGYAGTTGDYAATVTLLVDTAVRETLVVPAGGSVVRSFPAWDGASVTYTATEKGGPGLAAVSIEAPSGDAVEGSAGIRKGTKLAAKGAVLDGGHGLYGIVLQGKAGGATTVDLKAAIKFPRASKAKIRLGAEPRPVSFTPAAGRDGATITVQGTGFVAGSRIVFDGTQDATSVRLTPSGALEGLCPAFAGSDAGIEAVVSVVNPDGQSGTAPAGFRFVGIPGPQWVQPAIGATSGGTTVTLHGARFRAGATVLFDGIAATDLALQNSATATCVVPAHVSGQVTVTVVDEFGRAGAGSVAFDYIDPPVVTSASPSTVPSFGGQTITLVGSEFVPGDRVFVAGAEAANVQVASRNSLTFQAPPGVAGPLTIQVLDPLGRVGSKPAGLTMTESFRDVTASAVPSSNPGSDFPGQSLAVADLSGDGLPDILVAASVPHVNTMTQQPDAGSTFLLNNGNGTFSDATSTRFSAAQGSGDKGQASALLLGDFDGNGTSEILLSRGTPMTAASNTFPFQGYWGSYVGAAPPALDTPLVASTRLFTAGAGGVFADSTSTKVAALTSTPCFGNGEAWQASASALGDLDGDGDLDLLVAAGGRVDTGVVSQVTWTYIKVPGYYKGQYYYYKDKALLTQTASQAGSARVLRNIGTGRLTTVAARQSPLLAANGSTVLDPFSADSVACGDLDGDGIADAVLLSKVPVKQEVGGNLVNASALRVLFSNNVAKLTFDATALPAVYDAAHPGSGDFWQGNRVTLGDLDGDGRLDIVVTRDQIGTWTDAANQKRLLPALRIFRNLGARKFAEETGSFLAADLYRTGGNSTLLGVRGIAFADVDRDGRKDLVVSSRQTTVVDAGGGMGQDGLLPAGTRTATRILLKNASGKFADDTSARIASIASGSLFQADCVSMTDFDGDGKMDIVLSMDAAPADGARAVRILLAR